MSGKRNAIGPAEKDGMWKMWRSGAYHLKEIAKRFGVCPKTASRAIEERQREFIDEAE